MLQILVIKEDMKRILISLFVLLFASCETDNMYSSHDCYFVFQASLFPSSALTRSVVINGSFCMVKAVMERGVTHLKLTPNQGTYAVTDLDLTMSTVVGGRAVNYTRMGYNQGLIIGRSSFGQLRAYDLQCPNCDFNYELKWKGIYELQCDKCNRTYNINGSEGYVQSGDKGHNLALYKNVTYNEVDGFLVVSSGF